MPCRHMCCVFFAEKMLDSEEKVMQTISKFWPTWSHLDNYLLAYKTAKAERPLIYEGSHKGTEADKVGAPKMRTQAGRPKKKRIRRRKKPTPKSIEKQMRAQRGLARAPQPWYSECLNV